MFLLVKQPSFFQGNSLSNHFPTKFKVWSPSSVKLEWNFDLSDISYVKYT